MAHSHLRVSTTACEKGDGKTFTENSHSAKNLARTVASFAKRQGDHLTKLQRNALDSYKNDTKLDLRNRVLGVSDEKALKAYLKLFADLFFFGTLSSRTVLVYDSEVCYNVDIYGKTNVKKPGLLTKIGFPSKPKWVITIYSYPEKDRFKRLLNLVGTLLHEMCHVFLHLWGCNKDTCHYSIEYGGKYHGYSWQDIAYVTETASKEFLGKAIEVGRISSLADELYRAKLDIPKGKLSKWEMDYSKVHEQLEALRQNK